MSIFLSQRRGGAEITEFWFCRTIADGMDFLLNDYFGFGFVMGPTTSNNKLIISIKAPGGDQRPIEKGFPNKTAPLAGGKLKLPIYRYR